MFRLPFGADEFFAVFARYNTAVWPAQLLLLAGALISVALLYRPTPAGDRFVLGFLATLWSWMALAYHFLHFSTINPAAYAFAALFLLEAVLLAEATGFGRVTFGRPRGRYGFVGVALLVYALFVYPLIGWASGHLYPAAPTFGAPCPTVIFTFGVLLTARDRVPGWLLIVPALWGVIGLSAALSLGVAQDVGVFVAALVATPLILWRNRRLAPAATPRPNVSAAPIG